MEFQSESSVEVTVASHGSGTLTAHAITRHYLASEHLWAALESARRARKLEDALLGHGKGTHPTHRAFAITACMSSVGFLEALVNEIYQDASHEAPGRVEMLSPECRGLMGQFWKDGERYVSILDKFQMALLFAQAPRLDEGLNPLPRRQLAGVLAQRPGSLQAHLA